MNSLDLAVIGNCTVASVISQAGRHVWFCFPRLDADPLFCSLLGGKAPTHGFMEAELLGQTGSDQRYIQNTAVLETILHDDSGGAARVVDFCPRFQRYGRLFRPPTLVRRIEPLAGSPRITVRLRPACDYGATVPERTLGSNHMRFIGTDTTLRVTTDMPLSYLTHEADFTLDRAVTLFVGADESVPEEPDTLGQSFLAQTTAYWREWVRDLNIPFDWQLAVIRAAITLKLCSFDDTGGIVAALTSSIPEAPGSGRNWDYRYCWPRDAYYTVDALNRLSATRTMESFMRYLIDTVQREKRGDIAPLYPIAPGVSLDERIADSLSGYQGDGPVRIGNAAYTQRQNDVYGSIILTGAQLFWDERLPRRGDLSLYKRLCPIAEAAGRQALEPDAGIWEYRGTQERHTYSAAMCWAALHRMALIAGRVGEAEDAVRWHGQAAALHDKILQRAITDEGWISGVFDSPVLDASTLLLGDLGLIAFDDPRFLKTLDVVGERLTNRGFVMRYKHPDDFGLPETAFLVCTFWYVQALAGAGRREQALELFENVLAHRNHVGLLAEDIDPDTGKLWGNFPQTYSQVGLILSAMRLTRSWSEGPWRA